MLISEAKKELLKSRPFRYLSSQEIDTLFTFCKIIAFNAKDAILKQGKKNNRMFIILEGEAEVYAQILGKGMIGLSTLHHGDFIGEISLISKEVCTATVIAKTPMQCFLITDEYFDTISLFFPDIRYKITRAIIENVCERFKNMLEQLRKYIRESNISAWFSFKEIKKSLAEPKTVNLADFDIDNNLLHKFRIFHAFNQEELKILLQYFTPKKAIDHCILISENEKNSSCYIVIYGAVEASVTENNKHVKLSILGPGSLFGNTSYFTIPTLINYVTREQALLLEITATKLESLQKDHLEIWYKLYNLICESLVMLERSIDKLFIRFNSEIFNR